MLVWVRTTSGATCKGVLQLEATFIDAKTCISTGTRKAGPWNTVPMLYPLSQEY